MYQKPVLFLVLSGIIIGVIIGTTDSLLHYFNLENYKILNILIFTLLFTTSYFSILIYRNKICNKLITYGNAFKTMVFTGFISSITIAITRYIYLNFISNNNLNIALEQTKQVMVNKYDLYTNEQIANRLSFIEFTYSPVISSLMYFTYYILITIIFAVFASIFIKRIDRNISLNN